MEEISDYVKKLTQKDLSNIGYFLGQLSLEYGLPVITTKTPACLFTYDKKKFSTISLQTWVKSIITTSKRITSLTINERLFAQYICAITGYKNGITYIVNTEIARAKMFNNMQTKFVSMFASSEAKQGSPVKQLQSLFTRGWFLMQIPGITESDIAESFGLQDYAKHFCQLYKSMYLPFYESQLIGAIDPDDDGQFNETYTEYTLNESKKYSQPIVLDEKSDDHRYKMKCAMASQIRQAQFTFDNETNTWPASIDYDLYLAKLLPNSSPIVCLGSVLHASVSGALPWHGFFGDLEAPFAGLGSIFNKDFKPKKDETYLVTPPNDPVLIKLFAKQLGSSSRIIWVLTSPAKNADELAKQLGGTIDASIKTTTVILCNIEQKK